MNRILRTAATTMTNTIKIDIVSDTVCPWCYIGKKRIETAMKSFKEKRPDTEFQVNWLPYQLDPSSSKIPMKKLDMYAKKFGSDRAIQIKDHMLKVGLANGIKFAYDGDVVNTLDSHRLIAFATKKGKQDEMVQELFENYFEQNLCGELSSLVNAAEKVGLDRTEVESFLKSDQGTKEIQDSIAQSRKMGVQGVPNITIQDKYVLSGAQEPETFQEVFERVLA